MVTVRGGHYSWGDLYARARRMPAPALRRNALDVALAPVRRAQVAVVPRVVVPTTMPLLTGIRGRDRCLDYLRREAWRCWPLGPDRVSALSAAIRAVTPGGAVDATRRAERALRHEFDLLGTGPFTMPGDVDWLCDVKTGRRWPPGYYRQIAYSDLESPSDVKVPWEISRCHQIVDLARATLLDPRDAYAEEIAAQLESFSRANPFGMTVNWACTMEVAVRAVNWCWALSVVASELSDDDLLAAAGALYQHGLFIETNLERSEVAGNHYISDAVGLLAVGTVFREASAGRRWTRLGESILLQELERQVYDDGVDHEMSVPYHRLCAEIFLFGLLLLRLGGREPEARHWDRLERMGEFAAAYTRPDGSAPVWGDADDGRLHRFGSRSLNDHRHLLSTLAVLFGRHDFAAAAGDIHEETLWLLGPAAAESFALLAPKPDARRAVGFTRGGFAVLRAEDVHVLFDAGPVGLRGRGGHGHNDALAFELWWGEPLVVDPGSYVYTADFRARNAFRSTFAHNTPAVDGVEIAEIGERGLWTIADQAQASLVRVEETPDGGHAEGLHVGYTRLQPDAVVRRTVRVVATQVVVHDAFDVAIGGWSVALTFAPGVVVKAASRTQATLVGTRRSFRVAIEGASSVEVLPAQVSPSYGVLRSAQKLLIHVAEGQLTTTFSRQERPDE